MQIKVPSNESDDMEPLRTYITIEDLQKLYDEEGAVNSTAKVSWQYGYQCALS